MFWFALFREQSHTEDESSHLEEASNLSTIQPNISEDADLSETTEEEKHNIKQQQLTSAENELPEGETINTLSATDVSTDELSGTEEEIDQTINTLDTVDSEVNEKDGSSVPNQVICQSEPASTDLVSLSGDTNVDVCAQELGLAEDEVGDRQDSACANEEIGDSEHKETTEAEEPEISSNPGQADVDICATELSETERSMVIAAVENDVHVVEEENLKLQPEETHAQSSLSHLETPEGDQQEADDHADKTKEEEGAETQASSGEIHQSLVPTEGDLDSNAIPKENSLVEISFEDVPEAQQITEVEEKQPEEEGSVEVLQTQILEHEDEFNYVSAVETDQTISSPQHHEGPEIEGVEKELNSAEEEVEIQHGADEAAKVETNASNLDDDYDDDNDYEEKDESVSSSHQQTTKEDKENPEDEPNHTNQDDREIEEKFNQNEESKEETMSDSEGKDDDSADAVGRDKEDMQTEGYSQVDTEDINDGSTDSHLSQVTQSNPSAAALEAESETLEDSALLPEESQKSLVESQPEDRVEEKEATSKEAEEVTEEGATDSEVQGKSDAMLEEEENTSLSHDVDRTDEGHQGEENDATEPEDKSSDKVKGFILFAYFNITHECFLHYDMVQFVYHDKAVAGHHAASTFISWLRMSVHALSDRGVFS